MGRKKAAATVPKKTPVAKKARKNPRSNGEDEQPQYDSSKFLSTEAQKFYEDNMGRAMNVEREFDFKSFGLTRNFQKRGWVELCQRPRDAAVPIVREFYSNARDCKGYIRSCVKGEVVIYDSETINLLYGFSFDQGESCAYRENLLKDWRELEPEVTSNIAVDGAVWKRKPGNPGKPLRIKESFLKPQARGVHKFVCSRLMPTTHQNELTWQRAILIHTILSGEPIDVGKIIQDEISELISGNDDTGNFIFPSLITTLCERAKVDCTSVEQLKPRGVIKQARPTANTQRVPELRELDEDEDENIMGGAQPGTREMLQNLINMVTERYALEDQRHQDLQQQLGQINQRVQQLSQQASSPSQSQ